MPAARQSAGSWTCQPPNSFSACGPVPTPSVFAAAPRSIAPLVPVIDVQFTYVRGSLRWFSILSTIGTPVDVTAQELRLEAFFPSDDDTATQWTALCEL